MRTFILVIVMMMFMASIPVVQAEPNQVHRRIVASEDSYVREELGDSNFDNDILSVKSLAGNNRRSFVKFTVQAAPYLSSFDNASLSLEKDCPCTGSERTYLARRLTSSWIEATVTWNNQPTSTSVNQSSITTDPAVGGFDVFNVTNIVEEWLDGTSNLGFLIRDETEDAVSEQHTFYFDHETSGSEPVLFINWTSRIVTQAVNFAFVLSFGAVCVLALIGANWLRKKRGGLS